MAMKGDGEESGESKETVCVEMCVWMDDTKGDLAGRGRCLIAFPKVFPTENQLSFS
jgi:hypothetical protein